MNVTKQQDKTHSFMAIRYEALMYSSTHAICLYLVACGDQRIVKPSISEILTLLWWIF